MNRAIMVIVLSLILSACVNLPSESEVKTADFGTRPTDYVNIVKTYYAYELGDPESIQYGEITPPKRYWIGNRMDDVYYGYLVCATLNAKNAFGQYEGFRTDAVIIHDNIVVKQVTNGDWWGEQLCPTE
jgi:hypothetical protein